MPPCATNASLHMRTGLEIKSISELYEEAHCVNNARTRRVGDNLVNHALTSKVTREANQTRKKSVEVTAETIYEQALRMNTVGGAVWCVHTQTLSSVFRCIRLTIVELTGVCLTCLEACVSRYRIICSLGHVIVP